MILSRRTTVALGLTAAAGLAIWMATTHRQTEEAVLTAASPMENVPRMLATESSPTLNRPALASIPSKTVQETDHAPRRPPPLPTRSAPVSPAYAPTGAAAESVWYEYEPTREELQYRARRVEIEAAHELRNLLGVLDLNEEQQDRVFAALVRRAEYFHPALQAQRPDGTLIAPPSNNPLSGSPPDASIGGTPPPGSGDTAGEDRPSAGHPISQPALPANDTVRAELTPPLADVYERYTSEREAFWVGIVEDIENDLKAP